MDKWDKKEKRMSFLNHISEFFRFLDFDKFYHRGRGSRFFANSMVLMGVAHLAIFSMWVTEQLYIWWLR